MHVIHHNIYGWPCIVCAVHLIAAMHIFTKGAWKLFFSICQLQVIENKLLKINYEHQIGFPSAVFPVLEIHKGFSNKHVK